LAEALEDGEVEELLVDHRGESGLEVVVKEQGVADGLHKLTPSWTIFRLGIKIQQREMISVEEMKKVRSVCALPRARIPW
jgi:hypothetical protein